MFITFKEGIFPLSSNLREVEFNIYGFDFWSMSLWK